MRHDPLLKLVCGRLPASDPPLASQPTFSRVENAVSGRDCYRIARALGMVDLRERGANGTPMRIVLDLDATDDPTHGKQEGTRDHDYYPWYTQRGATENWIKDFKRYVKCDRLSCHRFSANQLRRFLHAAASWRLDTLRRNLIVAGMARMTLERVRLRVVKIGGRARQWPERVRLHVAARHPGQSLWHLLAATAPRL